MLRFIELDVQEEGNSRDAILSLDKGGTAVVTESNALEFLGMVEATNESDIAGLVEALENRNPCVFARKTRTECWTFRLLTEGPDADAEEWQGTVSYLGEANQEEDEMSPRSLFLFSRTV